MNKERLLIFLVCILLLMNIVTMGLIYFKGQKKSGGPQMRSEIEREKVFQRHLRFDEDQMQVYRASKAKYKESVKDFHQQLHLLSQRYYHSNKNLGEASRDSLLTNINSINSKIYLMNAEHFDELRRVCRDNQLPQLHEFIDQLILGKDGHQGRGERNPKRKR